jgi:competence protein ComEC
VAALGFNVEYVQKGNTVQISSTDYKPEESGPAQTQTSVTVSFIDVGQGDSVFIDAGDYEILIDAGTADKGVTVSNYIKPYVDGDLDLMIATHAHADHVGGLARVLADYQVDEIVDSGDTADSKSWTSYHNAAVNEPNCTLVPDSDMTFTLPDGAQMRIIEALDGDKNLNNDSVAALFTYGAVKVLLTGDNEEAAEAVLAGKAEDVDVFKAAHHGSRTANTMALLSVIKPEYVVVSCGTGNTYGHPHAEALENFAAGRRHRVFGTEKSGTVVMTTDGVDLQLQYGKSA